MPPYATRRFSKIPIGNRTHFFKDLLIDLVCTYSSKGAQNILTILNMKNGSQQIPNITTTDVIILMDFFFLAIKFISLPSSLLPGIKDIKYKGVLFILWSLPGIGLLQSFKDILVYARIR